MPNHDDHNGHENGEFDGITRLFIRTHPADVLSLVLLLAATITLVLADRL